MKNVIALAALLATAAAGCNVVQDHPASSAAPEARATEEAHAAAAPADFTPASPSDDHVWLQQLVGEWSVHSEASMGPDAEPMVMDSTASTRAIGDLWILSEGHMDFDGMAATTLLTLGYDFAQQAFVGSWVDTMQTHLWTYRGQLDAAGKTLTLETSGPSWEDPAQSANYRDSITILGDGRFELTSSIQGADGSWTTFMSAEYTRKK
jgi:hypothetical protein